MTLLTLSMILIEVLPPMYVVNLFHTLPLNSASFACLDSIPLQRRENVSISGYHVDEPNLENSREEVGEHPFLGFVRLKNY